MVATANDTTVRRIRIDTLAPDAQELAWSLFQDGMSLSEAIDEALSAIAGLAAYAAAWDAEADAALLAAYWPSLDSVEEVTPPPAAPAARPRRAAPAVELEVQRVGAAYLVSSGSRPGLTHTVVGGRCSCEAGRWGRACRHVAAVERLQAAQSQRVAA